MCFLSVNILSVKVGCRSTSQPERHPDELKFTTVAFVCMYGQYHDTNASRDYFRNKLSNNVSIYRYTILTSILYLCIEMHFWVYSRYCDALRVDVPRYNFQEIVAFQTKV